MKLLSLISLFSCILFIVLGQYSLLKNRKSNVIRSFFYLAVLLAVYALACTFFYAAKSKEAAEIWYKVSSVGWTLFPVFFLILVLRLTGKDRWFEKWYLQPLIFLPGLVFLYLSFTNLFYTSDFVFYYGYWLVAPSSNSIWYWSYMVYVFGYIITIFLMIFVWGVKSKGTREKKQSRVILVTLALIFVIAIVANAVFPVMRWLSIPDVGHVLSLFMVIGLSFAIIRFKAMVLTREPGLHLIFSKMHDYLFIIDANGTVVNTNAFTTVNLGFNENDMLGHPYNKYFESDMDSLLAAGDEKDNTDNHQQEETGLISIDNTRIPVTFSFSCIHDEFGDIAGYIFVGYDTRNEKRLYKEIHERKAVEFDLVLAREKAEEADKLKSTFLSNISHELRTPLNGILGFSDILKSELKNTDHEEIIEYIDRSGNRLLGTLNSIIDLSLIMTNKHEIDERLVNIPELVEEKAELYKAYASSKNLFLEINTPDTSLVAKSDPRLLGHVMKNLIDNAIKYTDAGGVSILVGKQRNSEGIEVIHIEVKDSGIGIDAADYHKIFESFRQISEGFNREYEGIGIGLSICKNFVDLLDGQIWVESEVGIGTVFHVEIPLHESGIQYFQHLPGRDKTESVSPAGSKTPKGEKPRILVVEDERTNREFMKYALTANCIVDTTVNGPGAVVMSREQQYQAIFMDINLGKEMSGIQTMKNIREIPGYKVIPIAAVTANILKHQKEGFIKEGFTHYLAKPFKRHNLKILLYEMLNNSTD
nr:response regulator [Bacteroidota bacterium]